MYRLNIFGQPHPLQSVNNFFIYLITIAFIFAAIDDKTNNA